MLPDLTSQWNIYWNQHADDGQNRTNRLPNGTESALDSIGTTAPAVRGSHILEYRNQRRKTCQRRLKELIRLSKLDIYQQDIHYLNRRIAHAQRVLDLIQSTPF
ncbi:Hypothetical protein [Gyrovirus GyV8]|uniref:Uncharacterized protein n=1 Tax=Gyrovirus GyV8 TaxID=1670973 RepID=A0A0G4AL03_9VIRU|nr:Hypothetical protein [Gyrovirus GyV8]AKM76224.1 Hypothetical protein [Gyrovirus GyV8]